MRVGPGDAASPSKPIWEWGAEEMHDGTRSPPGASGFGHGECADGNLKNGAALGAPHPRSVAPPPPANPPRLVLRATASFDHPRASEGELLEWPSLEPNGCETPITGGGAAHGAASDASVSAAVRMRMLEVLGSPSSSPATSPRGFAQAAVARRPSLEQRGPPISHALHASDHDAVGLSPRHAERASDAIPQHTPAATEAAGVFLRTEHSASPTAIPRSLSADAQAVKTGGAPSECLDALAGAGEVVRSTSQRRSRFTLRRLPSWLSSLYSGSSGAKAESASDRSSVGSADEGSADSEEAVEDERSARLSTGASSAASMSPERSPSDSYAADASPRRGILKAVRPPCAATLAAVPPPVHKATFLRAEELARMARFATSAGYYAGRMGPWASPDASSPPSQGGSPQASPVRTARLRFDLERTAVGETHSRAEYERGGVEYVAKSLTFDLAMMIKRELNDVKREMAVHDDSRRYTQFYQLR